LFQNLPNVKHPSDFASVAAIAASNGISQFSSFGQDDFGVVYDDLAQKIETLINMCSGFQLLQLQVQNLHSLLERVMVVRRTRDNAAQQSLLEKVR
jgi:hypothetical protein